MPIYEYRCKACEHKFDKLQKINDPLLTDCPECGQSELIKLVSASGFRLKGTGWYETDFKNSGKKPPDSGTKDSTVKSNGKKTDTKTSKNSSSTAT